MEGSSVLTKGPWRAPSPLPPCEDRADGCGPGGGFSSDAGSGSTSTLDFQPPRLRERNLLSTSPQSVVSRHRSPNRLTQGTCHQGRDGDEELGQLAALSGSRWERGLAQASLLWMLRHLPGRARLHERQPQGSLLAWVAAVPSSRCLPPTCWPCGPVSFSVGSLSPGMHTACRRRQSPTQTGQPGLTSWLGM